MDWLSTFLALPHGIPSHDTISRLFAQLDPEQLQECFLSWIQTVAQLSAGTVVAVDGKTLRHSCNRGKGKGATHIVSAWAAENRWVLGQVKKVGKKAKCLKAGWDNTYLTQVLAGAG